MSEWLAIDGATLQRLFASAAQPFASAQSRTGFMVLFVGWTIGALAFAWYARPARFRLVDYLRHAFPARVYLSRSFAVDLQLLLFSQLLRPARWIVRGLSVTLAAGWLAQQLRDALGSPAAAVPGPASLVLLAALLLLAYDFGTYVNHRLSHRIPALWAFHRVHHSAEVLNPLTLERKHPCYDALAVLVDCLTVAPLQALILFFWGGEVSGTVLATTNFGFLMFAYAASSLRHTHIWLSFGPVLGRVFVSPALHQIHHSKAPAHHDRNYGEVLALWDWAFGSLYLPKGREELDFGLAGEAQPHGTLAAALLEPFAYAGRALLGRRRTTPLADQRS